MATTASWITRRPHSDGEEACIRDTNVNVWGLVERRRRGMSDADILADIQGLTPEDLQAAWEYQQAHRDEIDRAIRLNADEGDDPDILAERVDQTINTAGPLAGRHLRINRPSAP